MIVKFLNSSTGKPIKPSFESAIFESVSNMYNNFIAEAAEKGCTFSEIVKEGDALIRKISDGTEVHLIP